MPKVIKKPQAVANLESAIVRSVQARGAVSRIELARELKLVASTAGIYVDRLIRAGYLIESAKTSRGLGRPPVLLELNPESGRFIGVDFDAREIMAVSVDFAQRPREQVRRTIPQRASAERVLATIEDAIAEVVGATQSDVLGIGLAVPGPIDPQSGISRAYKFIRGWNDVAIGPRMADRFHLPVYIENNLRSMALGELWCGQGRGLRHMVCLGIRSGIGSGIIVDGKLLTGANNAAGEIGRWTCPDDSTATGKAAERKPRTIEDAASLTGVLNAAAVCLAGGQRSVLGKPGDTPTVAELLSAAEQGDRLATRLIDEAARRHGWIAHQLASLFDPQRIIIAGPLVESDAYLETLQQEAAALRGTPVDALIVRSTLGELAGALGAAALAFHHWKPRR